MKLSFRNLFALSALAVLSAVTFGCSKSEDSPTPAPQSNSSVAKPDGGGSAPPKTHD